MTAYEYTFIITQNTKIQIEADSEAEARQQVQNMSFDWDETIATDLDVSDIELIEVYDE